MHPSILTTHNKVSFKNVNKCAAGGRAKHDAALAPPCHVLIITKFGEFLPNRFEGNSMTDQQTDVWTDRADYQVPPYFQKNASGK